MRDKRRQHGTDVIAHHEIGQFIELGSLTIDNHEPGVVSFCHQRKSGGRPYDQGRANCEKKITVKRDLLSAAHLPLRHCLPERYRCGLDVSTTVRTIRRAFACPAEPLAHPIELVTLPTVEAEGITVVAMQLDDVLRGDSRALMKVVDVLRDYGGGFPRAIKACQRKMTTAWLRGGKLRVHCEAPSPRFVAHFPARKKVLERNRLVLGPEPTRRAKIGNAALGGNAGTGERRDHPCRFDQPNELVNGTLQVLRDHVCSLLLHFLAKRCKEVSPGDICIPCCACATLIPRSTSSATSSGSRRSAGAWTRRTAICWWSSPPPMTRAGCRR